MTHGGSGSGDGGTKIIRVVQKIPLPDWLTSLQPYVGTLKSAARTIQQAGSLENLIKVVIASWVVSGILGAGGFVIDQILLAFEPLLTAIATTESAIVIPFRIAGVAIFDVLRTINASVASVTGVAGPAAAPITAAFITLTLVLGYRLAVSVLGEVPVLSSITDFLGVRP